MIWVDAVVVLIVAVYAYFGWKRGFIRVLADLVVLIISLFAALFLYSYVAPLFEAIGLQPIVASLLALMVVFFVPISLLRLLIRRILRRVPASVVGSPINRALGVLLGAAEGILIVAVAVLALVSLPVGIDKAAITESVFGGRMLEVGAWVERTVVSVVPEEAIDRLTFRTVPPEGRQRIDIPATTNIRIDPNAENRMLSLVNQERTDRGLQPLTMDPQLREVAREHSRDMFRRGYFAHINLEGEDAFDRMRARGIRFTAAGENLAMAPTMKIAHEGLMESPGHRANILNPRFRRVGIGAGTNPAYGTVYTQNFTN